MESKIEELEEIIGYKFKDKSLLELALTHSSYSNDQKKGKMHNNERLEFLGDAVLELTSSEVLFHEYREKTEGELTRLRASLVCEPTLADCAREIHLGDYLLLSHGEDRTGGRNRDSVISDAFEALIGAIYLDGGYNSSKTFIKKYVLNDIENKQLFFDSKTILQELLQKDYKERVEYVLTREYGPDHDKHFAVDAVFRHRVIGSGEGTTKKRAEQQAAYEAILKIRK
ncbi:MAG: ribonuclease III [Lachnospiraceae bacterium]|nr:ribonuclease III [Lachnospiraceae bacterium]MCI9369166.1 ribonuclease III [Lachnospiraceae bacterium]